MDNRPSLPALETFAQRHRFALFLGLLSVVGLYLVLPLGVSYLLTRGLFQHGYENVRVQLGYPGLRGITVPVVSLQQNLGGETLLISLTNAEVEYRIPELLHGHVDRIFLPDVAIQVLTTRPHGADDADQIASSEENESPWSLLTAGDLLHRLPILPFDELHLERITVFREEATGPLRKVTVSGLLRYQDGELGGQLSFQGRDTATYGLTVTGNSASTWSATLVSQRLQAVPIVSWRSQAHPSGRQIQVKGQLDVNVRELAPFIALLVPIGPDLGKVTGHITVNWTGTADADAALTSLWLDARTQLEGRVQAQLTLPALKGTAKDMAVAYQGAFTGNARQVEWTLAPGVPLVASVNSQSLLLPEAVRKILPRGDQPVRIDNSKPVQGTLYWSESPVRMTVDGPLHVTYGSTPGPLMAELEMTHAEWGGSELLSAESTYHVVGIFPKAITEMVAAQEATGEFRGALLLTHSHVRGVVHPSSSVTARQIERGTASVPHATLQLTEALPLQCDLAVLRCSAGPTTIAIRIPALQLMGRDIRVAQSTLTLQLAETTGPTWHTQGKLSMRGVSLNSASWGIQPTEWKIRFVANQAGIKADLRVDAPFHGNLMSAEIDQPLGAGDGMLHGTIGPIEFDGETHRLGKLVTGLPWPIEITDGRLASTVDMSWSGGPGDSPREFILTSGTARVVAEKLSGRYDDTVLKDASSTMEFRANGMTSIETVEPAAVTIASVRTGIDVNRVSTMVHGKWRWTDPFPVIEFTDFHCEMFGGTVTSAGLVMDPASPPYHATFSIQDWDLAKILSVEPHQGVQGTGILNGSLPISMTTAGVTVKDGTMVAMPPGGIIRYASTMDSSKGISETNTQLHLVTQALNNFHYTLLRVGVDYAESGMLLLSARLEGRNPDLKKVPPINFNLTVQEHIPTLLKSLRLVEEIEKSVEGKFRRP
jgi:hypothetical protein